MERPPYSGGMISEFNELSDKIGLLAEMTHALRRENAQLRKDNAALSADNAQYVHREAQERVEALLEKVRNWVQAGLEQAASEAGAYSAENGKEA
jgi:FtsZ-binding cell division protein ZapB